MRSSVIGTIIAAVAWFVFIVLFLAFYAGGFDFWQKLAVFLASAAIVGGAIAVFWTNWALGKEKVVTDSELDSKLNLVTNASHLTRM